MQSKIIKQGKFKSKSSDKTYITRIYDTFDYCDCKGFQVRKKCRHVDELKKEKKIDFTPLIVINERENIKTAILMFANKYGIDEKEARKEADIISKTIIN